MNNIELLNRTLFTMSAKFPVDPVFSGTIHILKNIFFKMLNISEKVISTIDQRKICTKLECEFLAII